VSPVLQNEREAISEWKSSREGVVAFNGDCYAVKKTIEIVEVCSGAEKAVFVFENVCVE